MSLSKTVYPLLSTGLTQEERKLSQHEILLFPHLAQSPDLFHCLVAVFACLKSNYIVKPV